jgi:iron complex transport system substrate-binding protein
VRIVSLLPSATEMICEIGLGDHLRGVSHECDYPPFVRSLPKVTQSALPPDASSQEIDSIISEKHSGTLALYRLDDDTIRSVEPEFIVTQSLCNVCAVAEQDVLSATKDLKRQPQIISMSPTSLTGIFESLIELGGRLGRRSESEAVVKGLKARVAAIEEQSRTIEHRPSVVMLEWILPPFSAGHWNPELVHLAGGLEKLGKREAKSARIEWTEVVTADPEVLVVACCGYDVERSIADMKILRTYPDFQKLRCAKEGRIYIADGSAYFNRPGPRLVDSLELLAQAIAPTVHRLPNGLKPLLRYHDVVA